METEVKVRVPLTRFAKALQKSKTTPQGEHMFCRMEHMSEASRLNDPHGIREFVMVC